MADGQSSESNWEEHEHDALVHSHVHYHVTHNFRELTGGFEHLSSAHDHDHDHAQINHRHYPHQDFEQEHEGEAHIHDHVQPARQLEEGNGKKATVSKPAADGEGNGKKAPARRTKASTAAK